MQVAGIRVILDIPGDPAPIWLHRAYPGVDLVSQNGARLSPAERYMDNISDPGYVRELGFLADTLTKRYAHHPAVIAVGYNNEIGNGFMSYSEADRQRFIAWLKAKYVTVEELNKAWATQRWSRRLSKFDDVDLPLADGPGPAERYLDLHRYWSDVSVARLEELAVAVSTEQPEFFVEQVHWTKAAMQARGIALGLPRANAAQMAMHRDIPGEAHATMQLQRRFDRCGPETGGGGKGGGAGQPVIRAHQAAGNGGADMLGGEFLPGHRMAQRLEADQRLAELHPGGGIGDGGGKAGRTSAGYDHIGCRGQSRAGCVAGTPALFIWSASSPDWNISRMMSQPPTNSPFT